jgi:hypothetical protein
MTKFRLAAMAATSLLFVVACSEGKDESPATVEITGEGNELLAHVPADTPYLFANLERVPDEVLDTFLQRAQPVLDEAQTQLSTALKEMEENNAGIDQASVDSGNRLALALLQELDGKLSRPGLTSLGLDIQTHHVVYGMGAFPVYRIGLSDPDLLRATIQRVLDKAAVTAAQLDHQGISYWRLGAETHDDAPVAAFVAILENHLAISLLPLEAEQELLPEFLGLEMPGDSDARARLAELNRKHDYTPYGSGILDLHRMADQFMDPESTLAQLMASQQEHSPTSFSAECIAEIHEIIDNAPMMSLGTTELTTAAIGYQYRIETPSTLAGQLMGLVSRIPAADALSERILDFSFGMRFGPVRDFLIEKSSAIVENPYLCEHLADMNQSAADTLEKLNQPMPPFLNNFRGIRASISEIMMTHVSIPENANGHLALHVKQPEMFVGMAQMFLPDLSELAITAGDPPVRLPESLLPVPGMVAFAAMSSDTIGLALGEGEEQGLPAFLDQKPGPEGTFLSASYDMATYMQYTDRIGKDMQGQHADHGLPPDHPAQQIAEAGQKALQDMMDRSHTVMKFTADGLVIDGRVTYK